MSHKSFNVRYNPNSTEGKVIDNLRESEVNLSALIRVLILYSKGYEFIRDEQLENPQDFCIRAIDYFGGLIEGYRTRLGIFSDVEKKMKTSKSPKKSEESLQEMSSNVNKLLP